MGQPSTCNLLAGLAIAWAVPSAAEAPKAAPKARAMSFYVPAHRWEQMPSYEMVKAVTPKVAREKRIEGRVVMDCRVDAQGRMGGCLVISEEPNALGLGAAALKLAPYYKLSPTLPDGRSVGGGVVRLPINFGSPRG